MANATWTMRHYNRAGSGVTSADYGNDAGGVSHEIRHAHSRNLTFYLNGVDELTFTLLLKDPMAAVLRPITSFVKVWRSSGGYSDTHPCFSGVVTQRVLNGEAGTVSYRVMNPLWRLQSRFHILNHYLNRNVDTGDLYTTSELMFKFIDLVNEAFGILAGYTGIAQGTFSWGDDPIAAPYFQARGSNTWSIIFDDLMSRDGSPDIIPEYRHNDGDPTLMLFSTAEKRGTDKSASIALNYRTGTPNLDDVTQTEIVVPGEYANYVWIVGHGGPNSGKIAMAENNSTSGYGYKSVGIYMKRIDLPEFKRYDAKMKKVANAELAQSIQPKSSFEAVVAPGGPLVYERDFTLGDVVALNANKDALQISGIKQRVYQVALMNSENNMETCVPTLADDFYGKVVT
jgi:hypothetical protein